MSNTAVDIDGLDDSTLTNGKSAENDTETEIETETEPSYQNAGANRTSRASITNDDDYENTVQNTVTAETNGLNGSASSSTTVNNNNVAKSEIKSELVNGNGNGNGNGKSNGNGNDNATAKANGNGNGNVTDAAKRSSMHDHSNAASKDELYDVPVGEFRIYTHLTHKKWEIKPKHSQIHSLTHTHTQIQFDRNTEKQSNKKELSILFLFSTKC